jgi:hypothetical protein
MSRPLPGPSRALLAGGAGLLLVLGACAEQPRPQASGNRVFWVDTQGAARSCTVPASVGLNAQAVTEVAMTVVNDGGWCGVGVAQGGRPYQTFTVIARPEHGRVHVRNVGDATRVDYYPDRGFSGQDSFNVAMYPGGARMKVNVTVQPGTATTAVTPAAAPAPTTPAPAPARTPARR